MRTSRVLFLVVLLGSTGCSRDPHYDIMREQAAAMQEVVEILRTVKDEETMKAARERLIELAPKREQIAARARKLLLPPSVDTTQRFQKDHPEAQDTLREWLEQQRRIAQLPGGNEFLQMKPLSATP